MEVKFSNEICGSNLVLVVSNTVLATDLKKIDSDGKLAKIIETQPFEAKFGEVLAIPGFENYENVWLIGAGEKGESKNYIKLGSLITRVLLGSKCSEICLWIEDTSKQILQDILSGMMLRDYIFDTYKKALPKQKLNIKNVCVASDALLTSIEIEELQFEASTVKMARDLINKAPCCIYPESLANHYNEWLSKFGVKVSLLKGEEIEDMRLLCAVARASQHQPYVVVMEWNGGAAHEKPIALVGKGVTYDSGGLSLKPSNSMTNMKSDMSGSAIVASVIANAAKNKYKKNIVGIVGLVENMVAGDSYRPDDVVTARSGKTIEINNTDAEGRLVLADILDYVQEKYSPYEIVDLATLTGAIVVALGHVYAGLFSNNDRLANELLEHGKKTNELLWRMPLHPVFAEAMNSPIADMKNCASGSVGAGSSTAAAFLASFIKADVAWAHLDIAGVSFLDGEDFASTAGATGFGVRLLNNWLKG